MLLGRKDEWYKDEEFGRQTLAGVNPCALEALKEMPAARGSAIDSHHVDGTGEASAPQECLPCDDHVLPQNAIYVAI